MDLEWIDTQFEEMVALVEMWANINSYSYNEAGLLQMLEKVELAFLRLNPDEIKKIAFPNGKGLFLKKRKEAPIQVFLGGHLDTVFPPDSSFQKVTYFTDRALMGPGVTDMKGGIVVLLKALEAFEKSDLRHKVGWEIFFNTDEEIGSIYSEPFILDCSARCDLALLFEPSWPDGSLVSARKGSANYFAYAKGKKAHAGRDPQKGVSAIFKLVDFLTEVRELEQEAILNVGLIQGGGLYNIVPDHAECGINLRSFEMDKMEKKLFAIAQRHQIKLECKTKRPPKLFDPETETLFEALKESAKKLKLSLKWKESGGVCDGNLFASKGVPTIDSLGVKGEKIHTEEETIDLKSLVERAKLTAHLLADLAQDKIPLKKRHK